MSKQSISTAVDIPKSDLEWFIEPEPPKLKTVLLATFAGSILSLIGLLALVRLCKMIRRKKKARKCLYEGGDDMENFDVDNSEGR